MRRWVLVAVVLAVSAPAASRAADIINPYFEESGGRFLRGFIHSHGSADAGVQDELRSYYRHHWDTIGVFGGYCAYGPLDGDGVHDFNGDGVVTGTNCYYKTRTDGTIDTTRCIPKHTDGSRLAPVGMEAFFPDYTLSAAEQGLGNVDVQHGERWKATVPGAYIPIRWCEYAGNGDHTNLVNYPVGDMWRVKPSQAGFDADNPHKAYLQNDKGNFNIGRDADTRGGFIAWAHPLRDCAWPTCTCPDSCESSSYLLNGLFSRREVMSSSYGQEIIAYGGFTHIKAWDWVLSQGYRRYFGFGAPDHQLEYPGGGDPLAAGQTPTADIGNHTAAIGDNVVYAKEFSERGIVEALKHGSFYVTNGHPATGYVDFTDIRVNHDALTVTVTATGATRIQWFGKDGALLKTDAAPTSTYAFTGSELYVRAVAENQNRLALYRSAGNLRAFTQAFFYDAAAVATPLELQVPAATTPPRIDGDLGEYAASPAASVAAAGASATYRLLWDDDALYIGVQVTDTRLRINGQGADGELWDGDGIEVMFDPEHDRTAAPDGDDRHYIVNVTGDLFDQAGAGSQGDRTWDGDARIAVNRRGTIGDGAADEGYAVEIAIPWTDLGGRRTNLGADFALNELDAGGTLSSADWAGLRQYAIPSGWGELVLQPAPAGDSGPPDEDSGPIHGGDTDRTHGGDTDAPTDDAPHGGDRDPARPPNRPQDASAVPLGLSGCAAAAGPFPWCVLLVAVTGWRRRRHPRGHAAPAAPRTR